MKRNQFNRRAAVRIPVAADFEYYRNSRDKSSPVADCNNAKYTLKG